MDSKTEPASEAKERIDKLAEEIIDKNDIDKGPPHWVTKKSVVYQFESSQIGIAKLIKFVTWESRNDRETQIN